MVQGSDRMFKFVFKWMFRLFLLAVVLGVIAVLSMDSVVRVVMERNIRKQTGMDAEIGRVSIGLTEPRMEIRDLKLFNPPNFGGTLFLDIPEIHVEYDRVALAESRLHLTLVRFNLGELDIVKNEAGRTNIFEFGLPLPAGKPGHVAAAGGDSGLAEFHRQTGLTFESLDTLNLSIGTAKYIDLKDQRNNRTQKIGIENVVVRNVKSPADLLGISALIALRSGDFFTSLVNPKDPATSTQLLKLVF